jgi:hypothetical protein
MRVARIIGQPATQMQLILDNSSVKPSRAANANDLQQAGVLANVTA